MKVKHLVFSALFLLTTNLLFAQDPNFHIYLCFGQSNMVGQGNIETQDLTVNNRFKVFQALRCSNIPRTKQTWYIAAPPTCQCYSKLSPADYFGRTMVANLPDSITIGIINVSVSGCDIRLFDKDIYQNYDSTYVASWFLDQIAAYGGNPYQYLINLAQQAQQNGIIKGILLHQGETNTGQTAWPSYVKKIYKDMLTDLSLSADSIPLLAGQVLSASGSCCSSMNTIINRLPDTIATAHVISSSGCTGQTDHAHFDSEGYRKIGRRYAVEMLSLMGYNAAYAEAECGTVGQNWSVLADNNASNSTYVTPIPGIGNTSTSPTSSSSMIQMTVSLSADTNYYLYGRFNNSSSSSDAFWIKIDNGAFELFDGLTTIGWEWVELKSLNLTAGTHTITIAPAEDGAQLDKLVIKNSERMPVSIGEEAVTLCTATLTTTGNIDPSALKGYALKQNYPNPGSGNYTRIAFEIPITNYVSLKIFNSRGVEVDELAGKVFSAGEHVVEFNFEKLPSGIYFYTITSDKFSATRKMIVPAK
jgi:Carbohydrate esterase, sialic acid-specific acetylesterase/Secretion system C-terminal sorting domain